ncbi:N-acetyltransferase DgcN [Sphingomonas sp.]|uniref:N-acetyltransferase DgcN n=1 Tax=Sphingomonas sp. TaxID=28214 RepID=UPI001B287199|nr:N-acetyltransferase DgcN [Sphingomonas sp.]MBO9713319.1 DUF1611 domain-containing protein [Sphingomonas sp.]
MNISGPYLLYLGHATDPLSVKTSRGLAVWRPELCVGEYRAEGGTLSLGLPRLGFAEAAAMGARTMILGVANAGGLMGAEAIAHVIEALRAGLDVASGLHDRLNGCAEIVAVAREEGRRLFDVREPPRDLAVGNGRRREGLRLLTVGTDCSVGKMYTTLALERELRARGVDADFRATGQTGILIAQSGIAIDAVVADFISGATEAISPARRDGGWDLIEGQGSLYHPSYAGVSLGLLHGAQPDAIVLCHEIGREHIRGIPGRPLPDLAACIEANLTAARLTNPEVVAVGVAVNGSRLDSEAAWRACEAIEAELGLPCQDPMVSGVDRIADRLLQCFEPCTLV